MAPIKINWPEGNFKRNFIITRRHSIFLLVLCTTVECRLGRKFPFWRNTKRCSHALWWCECSKRQRHTDVGRQTGSQTRWFEVFGFLVFLLVWGAQSRKWRTVGGEKKIRKVLKINFCAEIPTKFRIFFQQFTRNHLKTPEKFSIISFLQN